MVKRVWVIVLGVGLVGVLVLGVVFSRDIRNYTRLATARVNPPSKPATPPGPSPAEVKSMTEAKKAASEWLYTGGPSHVREDKTFRIDKMEVVTDENEAKVAAELKGFTYGSDDPQSVLYQVRDDIQSRRNNGEIKDGETPRV